MSNTETIVINDPAQNHEWKWVNITNDFMFVTVFSDPELCKPMLEIILNKKISKITYPEGQKVFRITQDAKSIRLDVYVKEDGEEVVYDVEMQTTNNNNLPKRSRYYQGLIDLGILRAGEDYNKLKTGYVIFICPFDPFGKDEYIYHFRNKCQLSDGSYMDLRDETEKIFVNAVGHKGAVSDQFKALVSLFAGNVATDAFTEQIQNKVTIINEDIKWRLEYMTLEMKLNDARMEGTIQGRLQGINQEKSDTIRRMTSKNKPIEDIADAVGLSIKQVQEMISGMSAKS